jgi:hypothetical protein
MDALDRFEVFDRFDAQLWSNGHQHASLSRTGLRTSRRILIYDNQCPGMRLQCR